MVNVGFVNRRDFLIVSAINEWLTTKTHAVYQQNSSGGRVHSFVKVVTVSMLVLINLSPESFHQMANNWDDKTFNVTRVWNEQRQWFNYPKWYVGICSHKPKRYFKYLILKEKKVQRTPWRWVFVNNEIIQHAIIFASAVLTSIGFSLRWGKLTIEPVIYTYIITRNISHTNVETSWKK